jgi:hypothetical protein
LPRITYINKEKKPDSPEKVSCQNCGKIKKSGDFYKSENPLHKGIGKIPYCKSCIREMCMLNGEINVERVKNTLKTIDKPFIYDIFKRIMDEDDNSVDLMGKYFRIMILPQYKNLGWSDSVFSPVAKDEDTMNNHENVFDLNTPVSREMIVKWGRHDDPFDYVVLEDFYNKMCESNDIKTAQDIEYLKKIAILSLKMDKALENNEINKAKQLGELFSKYMADSKFRAIDKTDADLAGGIRGFGAIYAEVEKEDFIPPWEEKYAKELNVKQDIVDKTIMYILNFVLKLNKTHSLTEPPEDTPKVDDE